MIRRKEIKAVSVVRFSRGSFGELSFREQAQGRVQTSKNSFSKVPIKDFVSARRTVM